MFEEWLEEMKENFLELDEEQEFLVREAYKIGLQRGYDAAVDTNLYTEVSQELSELCGDDDRDDLDSNG